MNHQKQRILFLSLGKGLYNSEAKADDTSLLKALKEGTYNYKTAKYSISGISEVRETPFMAEIVAESFCPDKIYIIGSVKSAWSGIYSKYCDQDHKTDIDTIKALIQIEQHHDSKTGCDDLDKLQQIINDIYKSGNVHLAANGSADNVVPEVLLIRYGINDDELLENYARLNAIWSNMNDSCGYEIAFDITHSFRSLPIYNLILLNYYRHLAYSDIVISHIYYGMFEVKSENNDIAPIVDLKELLDILSRTNGVSEFRNTGNTVTLFPLIDNESFKSCLAQLDWATQINDFNKINDAFIRIGQLNQSELGKNHDIYKMTIDVLNDKLLDNVEGEFLPSYSSKTIAEKQYMLSRWYQRQNRYGIAIATGLEALRSFLVPLYLSTANIPDTAENQMDENKRRSSIDYLTRCTQNLSPNCPKDRTICELLSNLEDLRKKTKVIRDRFAHNLTNPIITPEPSSEAQERNIVDEFLDELQNLKEALDDPSRRRIINKYYSNTPATGSSTSRRASSYARIIIGSFSDSRKETEIVNQLSRTNSRSYNVYTLCSGIQEKLNEDNGSRNSKPKSHPLASARFLEDYLITHFNSEAFTSERSNVSLIFYNLTIRQKMHYIPYLQYKGFRSSKMYYLSDDGNGMLTPVESFKYITQGSNIPLFEDQPWPKWGTDLLSKEPSEYIFIESK